MAVDFYKTDFDNAVHFPSDYTLRNYKGMRLVLNVHGSWATLPIPVPVPPLKKQQVIIADSSFR